jgi:hypothetical protein
MESMKTKALKRKSPDRELEKGPKGRKDRKVASEQEVLEKRKLRAERKVQGSPDYQVELFAHLTDGLPDIPEEIDEEEAERMLGDSPMTPPASQSPTPRSSEEMSDSEFEDGEWEEVKRRPEPRQVPGGQAEGNKKGLVVRNSEGTGYKIPRKQGGSGAGEGSKDRGKKEDNPSPPPGEGQ